MDGGWWLASRPGRFIPIERTPNTHWIGGWADSRAGLDLVSKEIIRSPRRELNPDHPLVQPVVSRNSAYS
jgi:hypothetical protein